MRFATIASTIMMMVLMCSIIAQTEAKKSMMLSSDQLMKIVTGFVDGLLKVNLKAHKYKCEYYKRHSKKSFEEALDLWDRTQDYWISWDRKINLTETGLAKILNVLPNIIEDIHDKCDGIQVTDRQFKIWMHKFENPNRLMKKVLKNIGDHGLDMLNLNLQSL